MRLEVMFDALAVMVIVAGGLIYAAGLSRRWSDWMASSLVSIGGALAIVAGPTMLLLHHAEAVCELVGSRADVPCR